MLVILTVPTIPDSSQVTYCVHLAVTIIVQMLKGPI